MRKVILLILVMIIILPSVFATLSTTLNSPSDSNSNSSTTLNFNCSVSDDTFDIASVKLFTDISGSWTQSGSTVSGNVNSAEFEITSISLGSYSWNCLAENTNADTSYATSNRTFTISSAGFSGTIPSQKWNEDSTLTGAFDLDDYFTGASSYTLNDNGSLSMTVDSDNVVTFIPDANWSGIELVTITSNIGSVSNEFSLNVTNIADPPHMLLDIPDQSASKNTHVTINMESYFSDHDNEVLNYTISSSYFTLTQEDQIVTLSPEINWEGTLNVTITALDGTYNTESNIFVIIIGEGSINTAPTIDSITPEDEVISESGDTIDFSVVASDSDGDSLGYIWSVNNEKKEQVGPLFSFKAEVDGLYTIKVEVYDGRDTTIQTWNLVIGDFDFDNIGTDPLSVEDSSSAICGNNIVEDGENCSTCALDVKCGKGSICQKNACVKKSNARKAILILFLIFGAIIGFGGSAYYFTTLKKAPPSQDQNNNSFRPRI
jgi:hypothetical protein